jgi:hypothetical protein
MHDASLVCRAESVGNIASDLQHAMDGHSYPSINAFMAGPRQSAR